MSVDLPEGKSGQADRRKSRAQARPDIGLGQRDPLTRPMPIDQVRLDSDEQKRAKTAHHPGARQCHPKRMEDRDHKTAQSHADGSAPEQGAPPKATTEGTGRQSGRDIPATKRAEIPGRHPVRKLLFGLKERQDRAEDRCQAGRV